MKEKRIQYPLMIPRDVKNAIDLKKNKDRRSVNETIIIMIEQILEKEGYLKEEA